jgi:hypothetical protein
MHPSEGKEPASAPHRKPVADGREGQLERRLSHSSERRALECWGGSLFPETRPGNRQGFRSGGGEMLPVWWNQERPGECGEDSLSVGLRHRIGRSGREATITLRYSLFNTNTMHCKKTEGGVNYWK